MNVSAKHQQLSADILVAQSPYVECVLNEV